MFILLFSLLHRTSRVSKSALAPTQLMQMGSQGQDMAGHGRAWQGMAGHGRAWQGMAGVVWVWDLGKMVLASLLCHNSSVKSMVWDPVATGDRSRLAISTMADMAAGTGGVADGPNMTCQQVSNVAYQGGFPEMDDDICKALTDLVRCSMKRVCSDGTGDPEPVMAWGLYVDYPKRWHVLTVDAEDDEFYPLLEAHLEAVVEFVDQQRAEKRPLLLHCFAGMNRSAALCAAYLMVKERMGLFRVVKLLSERRGWILSNEGFMHQLVRLARDKELLDPVPSPRLDVVAEEPHHEEEPECLGHGGADIRLISERTG
eukprot:Skav229438  [mRNA]  locus=scaffold397:112418:117094:- [translate_table: standard]